MTVLPCEAVSSTSSARDSGSAPLFSNQPGLPTRTLRRRTFASTPKPLVARKSSSSARGSPHCLVPSTTALAIGCSLPASTLAASTSVCFPSLFKGIQSVNAGSPLVMVPVLSNMIVLSRWAVSRASLFLNRMPMPAPLPVPTIMAVGVANPNAQGHAITSTATIRIIAGTNSPPTAHQTPSVIPAMTMITGTKTAETLSASRWMGGLDPWA